MLWLLLLWIFCRCQISKIANKFLARFWTLNILLVIQILPREMGAYTFETLLSVIIIKQHELRGRLVCFEVYKNKNINQRTDPLFFQLSSLGKNFMICGPRLYSKSERSLSDHMHVNMYYFLLLSCIHHWLNYSIPILWDWALLFSHTHIHTHNSCNW